MLMFPREIGLRRSPCLSRKIFDSYITSVNGKASCYTSLYSFQRKDPRKPYKMDMESVVMDRAWWDFDMEEGGTLDDVKKDVAALISRLSGDIRTVFTGRGFHIHQLFKRPVIGTSIARHIDRYERAMALNLSSLDGVGHPHKLTRVPNTYNPARRKWAVNISTREFVKDPLNYHIPVVPKKEYNVYDPFRGREGDSDFDIITWIAQNPLQEEEKKQFHGDIGCAGQVPLPPCLDTAIRHENPKHYVRLALAQHLAESLRCFAHPSTLEPQQRREIVDTIVSFISTLGWRDYNQHITRTNVSSILDYEYAPSKCVVDVGPCWAHNGVKR